MPATLYVPPVLVLVLYEPCNGKSLARADGSFYQQLICILYYRNLHGCPVFNMSCTADAQQKHTHGSIEQKRVTHVSHPQNALWKLEHTLQYFKKWIADEQKLRHEIKLQAYGQRMSSTLCRFRALAVVTGNEGQYFSLHQISTVMLPQGRPYTEQTCFSSCFGTRFWPS